MTSNTAHLPIILRNEPFGGLLFDPSSGTTLELDGQAYQTACDYLVGSGKTFSQEEKTFIGQMEELLDRPKERNIRHIHQDLDPVEDENFLVFSAPTLIDFQITGRCLMDCPHCYASATPDGTPASLADIERVLEQAKECGVCQIALGGGEPLLHPDIERVLRLSHDYGIVPNLTTNGMHLTDTHLSLLKTYCGAVGLSLEGVGEAYDTVRKTGFDNLCRAIERLKRYEISTVLQVTLSCANFSHLDTIADFCLSQPHLYGVLFLAYKPVGRGAVFSQPLADLKALDVAEKLGDVFQKLSESMRVGYDCCMAPGVASVNADKSLMDDHYLEGCSACRGSVGISSNLDVIPCTFLPERVLGNLKKESLKTIWKGHLAEEFKRKMIRQTQDNPRCVACHQKNRCLGGCPVMPLVNCGQDYLGREI